MKTMDLFILCATAIICCAVIGTAIKQPRVVRVEIGRAK